jgi:hypothetical protein
MFAKLLKYEWKSSSKVLGVLSLAALGAGILGTVVLRLLLPSFRSGLVNGYESLLPIVLVPIMGFLILTLVGYVFTSMIYLVYRFYKSKFTDQGYLTFTLPVSSHQIFLASLVNMLCWAIIVFAVIVVSAGMMLLIGTAQKGLFNFEIFDELRYMNWIFVLPESVSAVTVTLHRVVSFIYLLIMVMTCLTIGAVVAKKHKILAAFGIYYGLNVVTGTISSILSSVIAFSLMNSNIAYRVDGAYYPQIIINLIMITGGYFLSTYLMKNKLNLP